MFLKRILDSGFVIAAVLMPVPKAFADYATQTLWTKLCVASSHTRPVGSEPAITTVSSNEPAGGADALFGKWDFTGKDSAGVAWRGMLTIGKPDPNRFDPARYKHMCNLDLRSANAERGVEAPCTYDEETRTLSVSGGDRSSKYAYSAVLSPDGKRLTQGKWSESEKEGPRWVETTGTWSASFAGK